MITILIMFLIVLTLFIYRFIIPTKSRTFVMFNKNLGYFGLINLGVIGEKIQIIKNYGVYQKMMNEFCVFNNKKETLEPANPPDSMAKIVALPMELKHGKKNKWNFVKIGKKLGIQINGFWLSNKKTKVSNLLITDGNLTANKKDATRWTIKYVTDVEVKNNVSKIINSSWNKTEKQIELEDEYSLYSLDSKSEDLTLGSLPGHVSENLPEFHTIESN